MKIELTKKQILRIKKLCRIEKANCNFCVNIGSDDDGSEYSMSSWPICHENESYENLKSFPFKKDMKCWFPEFWASKFADLIKTGSDKEFSFAVKMFGDTIETAIMYADCESRHMWE